jgi:hypothetical protein
VKRFGKRLVVLRQDLEAFIQTLDAGHGKTAARPAEPPAPAPAAATAIPPPVLPPPSKPAPRPGRGLAKPPQIVARALNANRIRACRICQRIFWAPRAKSECCSQRCRKVYNQRNSRARRKKETLFNGATAFPHPD